ncbi:MAG TPA: terminase small subunit, partial [Candidatus Dormibacteraeota bacterium]|nr:terminase small subunit [Candidatus Dormibacteraeota bacterium]
MEIRPARVPGFLLPGFRAVPRSGTLSRSPDLLSQPSLTLDPGFRRGDEKINRPFARRLCRARTKPTAPPPTRKAPPMNHRMQIFVAEYLVTLNATEAARRAGYSSRHAGLRGYALLRRPDVQLAIRAAMDARAARTGVSADRVVEELASIAFSDMRKILDFGPNHVRLRPASEMSAFDRAAIKSISVRIGRRGCGN